MEILNSYSLATAGMLLNLKKSQVANLRNEERELSVLEVLLLRESQDDRLLKFFEWQYDERLFWKNIEELQSSLRYNDQGISNLFDTPLRIFRQSRAKSKSLSWRACQFFNSCYKVHPALWLTKEIDIECIVKNITSPFKSNAHLPKRFEGGGSRMLTLSNLVEYVESTWGKAVSNCLISSLQITSESLQFERNISIRTFSDFHKKMRLFGAKDHHYEEMGANNSLNSKTKSYLSQKIPAHISQRHQAMNYFVENLSSIIDNNRTLTILESSKSSFIVQTTPTQLFIDSYAPEKPFAEYEIALYIKGHTKVFPSYFNYPEYQKVELSFNKKNGQAIYSCFGYAK